MVITYNLLDRVLDHPIVNLHCAFNSSSTSHLDLFFNVIQFKVQHFDIDFFRLDMENTLFECTLAIIF